MRRDFCDGGRLILTTAAVLFVVSCASADKKARVQTPPAQAKAPTIVAQAQPKPEQPKLAAKPITAHPRKTDPVEGEIKQAEQQYQEGQQNYNAGHLEAAKENFDDAVDALLQGPVAVRSDDRLQNELDKITDSVSDLEMAALQQGDGFTEQKDKPAPIDDANDVTFPVDPNIKAKAEAELKDTTSDLPLVINDYVAGYINFFSTRGRITLEHSLARSGRYRDMIRRVFQEEGVPQDLIYVAEAESGFEPLAVSRAGARGMWQFMGSRAAGYGLERSWWIDERQDPEKATRAAARHLKDLYNEFGDWYLAIAAYNSGPGNVQQAVKRTGYADFWELYKRNVLPKETKNYVPIILAYTIMAKNPAQYGLEDVKPAPALDTDTVTVNYPIDLRLVAECVDSDLNTLTELNPSLLRLTTPKDSTYDLHLPAGTKEKFEQAIAAIPLDKRVSWRYHHVAAGDTLDSIARHYHTSPKAIKEVNGMESAELETDQKIIIPVTLAHGRAGRVAYSRHPTHYKVHRGDTVLTVADDFGVPADRLRRWNRLRGDQLHAGKVLVIYRPLASEQDEIINSPRRRAVHHRSKHHTSHAKTAAVHKTKTTKKPTQTASGSATADRTSAALR
ncbi:MAG TPA: transglycosylase SLT domain-containing protein [Terriglobales bacterium]|nr:transglycosylase SLT domain-containing protein [Terriglobales bacterium]